jgi:hypothetical protein
MLVRSANPRWLYRDPQRNSPRDWASFRRRHPQRSRAAIAFDATFSSSGTGVTLTYTHTVGAGLSNSILVVGVEGFFGPGNTVSGITYNSVALTKIRSDNNGVNAAASDLWFLLSPAAGANSVVVTMSASVTIVAGSVSFSGVAQTGTIDAQTGSTVTGTHSSHSDTITTIADNAWIMDGVATSSAGGAPVAGGSQTQRWNVNITNFGAGSTLGPVTPAGATAISWSFTSYTGASCHSVVSLTPAVAAIITAIEHQDQYRPPHSPEVVAI